MKRILNLQEVKTGIIERAGQRAARETTHDHMIDIAANVDVATVVERDAWPKGITFDDLSDYDRRAFHWLYVNAYSEVIMELVSDAENGRISTLANAMKCLQCGKHAGASVHDERMVGTIFHDFVCPHNLRVTIAEDCVVDHVNMNPFAPVEAV